MQVEIDAAIAQIQGASLIGRIVPFVGAGLSRPLCRGWSGFLDALNRGLGIDLGRSVSMISSDERYRVADRAAFTLRLLREEDRRRIIVDALLDDSGSVSGARLPDQAVTLAKGYWPLVITTNYDDVLLAALHVARPPNMQNTLDRIRLLGRGSQDCEDVVRALDTNQSRIIWHIQGYVEPVVPNGFERVEAAGDRTELLDQIVIGHQQYQLAANQSPAFRRAFAEIYRRRSLLFIGSGLAESYFINLISEVTLNYGPSPQAHFALFSQSELDQLDTDFLQVRLGITSVCYGKTHAGLADALERVCSATRYSSTPSVPRPLSLSYDVPRANGSLEFSVRFSELEKPGRRECVVLNRGMPIGKTRRNADLPHPDLPRAGPMATNFVSKHFKNALAGGGILGRKIGSQLYRVTNSGRLTPVFLLDVRDDASTAAEKQSLTAIAEATAAGLHSIESLGEFDTVYMVLIIAESRTAIHPTFSFIAQLGGVRRFALQSAAPAGGGLRRVEIRLVDPSVIAPIVGGRIPIQELISSDRIRVLVRVSDAASHTEAFTVNVPADAVVADALRPYNLLKDGVQVEVSPLPYREFENPLNAPVFPTMTIEVTPG